MTFFLVMLNYRHEKTASYLSSRTLRNRAVVACEPHKFEVDGSSPSSASNLFLWVTRRILKPMQPSQGLGASLHVRLWRSNGVRSSSRQNHHDTSERRGMCPNRPVGKGEILRNRSLVSRVRVPLRTNVFHGKPPGV